MKTRTWIFLLLGLFILCTSLALWPREEAVYAQISSQGQLVRVVDLRIDQEFTVTTPQGGENTVTVRDGKISVTAANCPDSYCIRQGRRSSGQIVCLPNRLVITFPGSSLDAVSG